MNPRPPTSHAPSYSAEQVRQGEIILRKPWERVVFMAGLFGGVALLLALTVFAVAA